MADGGLLSGKSLNLLQFLLVCINLSYYQWYREIYLLLHFISLRCEGKSCIVYILKAWTLSEICARYVSINTVVIGQDIYNIMRVCWLVGAGIFHVLQYILS